MTMIHKNEKRTERFNFRITVQENELIKAAAQLRQISASQYVAQSAAKQAEIDLADRRFFTLSPKQMEAFQRALDGDVQKKPRLQGLFAEQTVLELEDTQRSRSKISSLWKTI